jgi:hypothetical protein
MSKSKSAILSLKMATASPSTIGSGNIDQTMPPSIRRKLVNVSPLYLSLAVTYAHVFLSPYTKVEESFTLHAVHDVLAYGHKPGHLSQVCIPSFPSCKVLITLVGSCHLSWGGAKILCPSNSAWCTYIPALGSCGLYGLDQNKAGCTDIG